MVDIAHDPETGQNFKYDPASGEWQPISAEGALSATRSVGENLARGAVGNNVDTISEAASAVFPALGVYRSVQSLRGEELNPILDPTGAAAASNDAAQAGRMETSMGTEIGSMLLDPTSLIGGGGAVKGATVAARAVKPATRMRSMMESVSPLVRRNQSLSAAENTATRTTGKMDFVTEEFADNVSMPLTRAERGMLRAAETQDEATVKAAERALGNEDFLRKTSVMGDTSVGDFAYANKDKAQWFTEEVAGKLGAHDMSRLTYDNVVKIRDGLSETFSKAFDEGNYPVSIRPEGGVDVLKYAREVAGAYDSVPASVNRLIKGLENAAKKGDGLTFDSDAMLEARKVAQDAAETAFAAGKHDTGTSITTILDTLDEAMEAALPEALKRDVQLARQRWKIKKVLERTTHAMSKTENGVINPQTFTNNWRQMTGGFKHHAREASEFEQIMMTIENLNANRAHAGNTLYRAVGPAAKGIGLSVGAGAAGSALFGN